MRFSRLIAVSVVVVMLVALSSWWGGHPREAPLAEQNPVLATAGPSDALSATWYCAAGTSGAGRPLHRIMLSNPTDSAVSASLTAYGQQGTAGETTVEIASRATADVDAAATFGADDLSVMVETPSGSLIVTHRLLLPDGAAQAPCATTSSREWHFPAITTTDDATARLVLFNPFPKDAGLDISAATDTGVQLPPDWTGIVVPAGTTKVLNLGDVLQRRDQFAISVVMRTGRVVAEVSQSFDGGRGVSGIRLEPGVPAARSKWVVPGGLTQPTFSERIVLYNPGEETVPAVVQVTPFGGSAAPPEPFELDVGPMRYQVIDLTAEARIPQEGYHSIEVETPDERPIVVGVVDAVTGEGTSGVPLTGGVAVETGSPVAATRWISSGIPADEGQRSTVFIRNTGEGIVTVDATKLQGSEAPQNLLEKAEIEPDESLALQVDPDVTTAGDLTVVIESSDPVVVSQWLFFRGRNDLSTSSAVPMRSADGREPVRLSGR